MFRQIVRLKAKLRTINDHDMNIKSQQRRHTDKSHLTNKTSQFLKREIILLIKLIKRNAHFCERRKKPIQFESVSLR